MPSVTAPTVEIVAPEPVATSTAVASDYVGARPVFQFRGGAGRWHNITTYTQRCRVSSPTTNAQGPLALYAGGSAELQLRNETRRFDPSHTASPYYADGRTEVAEDKPVRVIAIRSGVAHPMFVGRAAAWIDSWPTHTTAETVLSAVDPVAELEAWSTAELTAGVGAGELTSERVHRILDLVGWPRSARRIDRGTQTMQATTLAGTAWSELQDAQLAEGGDMYVSSAGDVVFRNRTAAFEDTRSSTVQLTFGESGAEVRYMSATPTTGAGLVKNRAVLKRKGSTTVVQVDNDDSQTRYAVRSWKPPRELLVETDASLEALGQLVVYVLGDPIPTISDVGWMPEGNAGAADATTWFHVVSREVGDRVEVRRNPPGGGAQRVHQAFIAGAVVELAPGRAAQVVYRLRPADRYAAFTLGSSTNGLASGVVGLVFDPGVDPGEGRIVYTNGQVVTAAELQAMTDQRVLSFTTAAQRDAQWPDPHDGAVCYLQDVAAHELRMLGAWMRWG